MQPQNHVNVANIYMTNIIIDMEVLKAFPLQSQNRQEDLLFPLLFNMVLDALARATKQKKQIKG